MFERFRRRDESAGGTADRTGGAIAGDATERRVEERSLRDREATAVADRDAVAERDAAAERDAGERRFEREDRTRVAPPATAGAVAPATAPADRPAEERDREVERHPLTDRDGDGVADRDREVERHPVTDRDGIRDREVERHPAPDRDGDGVADRAEHRHAARGPLVAGETMAAVRERQRERFGGVSWGSALFGFLAALGLAAILTAILAAAGVALGLVDQATGSDASTSDAETIGLGGAIALLLVLAIAWYCGGYAAGRMSRFDGGRQGLGVWAWTIVAAVVVAALAAVGGSKYDVFQSLNLPSLPVNGSTLTGAGAIAGAAAIVVTLVAAVVGGKVGERFHRRVDRVAHADPDA
ncbi:MAG TPA: hypothetical protein VLA98_09050 [Solirubrobacteraceae bacterium]|nr:hypothetical protein [Solirubrobacteraceae bacterium]